MARKRDGEIIRDVKRKVAPNRASTHSPLQQVLIDLADSSKFLTEDRFVTVEEEGDLPAASGSERQLEDNTVYMFVDFVTSTDSLVVGSTTPTLAPHGGIGGFIHTGGGAAIKGTDSALFLRNCLISAPGGTIFDISGDQTTEMLVESCSFSDAAGLGNIASLGTIDGYRVPTFKGCNFEDFDGGLTFDGSPNKIFLSSCPFRGVTASAVSVLTFAGTLTVETVDIVDCYMKDMQSDTKVVNVAAGGTPEKRFKYRGITHDEDTVTTSNILTGEAGVDEVGYWVTESSPLRNSAVVGELDLDSSSVTTISTQNTWYKINGAASLGAETARITSPSDATLTYQGRDNVNAQVLFSASMLGANGDTYQVGIFVNGNLQPASTAKFEAKGTQSDLPVVTTAIELLTPGDDISIRVRNLDSTSDATFESYNFNLASV